MVSTNSRGIIKPHLVEVKHKFTMNSFDGFYIYGLLNYIFQLDVRIVYLATDLFLCFTSKAPMITLAGLLPAPPCDNQLNRYNMSNSADPS